MIYPPSVCDSEFRGRPRTRWSELRLYAVGLCLDTPSHPSPAPSGFFLWGGVGWGGGIITEYPHRADLRPGPPGRAGPPMDGSLSRLSSAPSSPARRLAPQARKQLNDQVTSLARAKSRQDSARLDLIMASLSSLCVTSPSRYAGNGMPATWKYGRLDGSLRPALTGPGDKITPPPIRQGLCVRSGHADTDGPDPPPPCLSTQRPYATGHGGLRTLTPGGVELTPNHGSLSPCFVTSQCSSRPYLRAPLIVIGPWRRGAHSTSPSWPRAIVQRYQPGC